MCEDLAAGRSPADGRDERGQGVCGAQREGRERHRVEHAYLGRGQTMQFLAGQDGSSREAQE